MIVVSFAFTWLACCAFHVWAEMENHNEQRWAQAQVERVITENECFGEPIVHQMSRNSVSLEWPTFTVLVDRQGRTAQL
jgi:hypothetical protein